MTVATNLALSAATNAPIHQIDNTGAIGVIIIYSIGFIALVFTLMYISKQDETTMYYIAVFNEEEEQIGWLDSRLELVGSKANAAGFSSKETANDVRTQVEHEKPDWYTELEE